MRVTEEQKQALAEVFEKINDVKIAMLTSKYSDNSLLHSRPMAVIKTEPDGDLWFFTYDNSEKADELKKDDLVNLSFVNESKGVYLSVSGFGEIVNEPAKMKELWNDALKVWFPDGLDNPRLALLKVDIIEAEYWDSNAGKMKRLFNMVKSLIKGEAAKPGEHVKVDMQRVNRAVTKEKH